MFLLAFFGFLCCLELLQLPSTTIHPGMQQFHPFFRHPFLPPQPIYLFQLYLSPYEPLRNKLNPRSPVCHRDRQIGHTLLVPPPFPPSLIQIWNSPEVYSGHSFRISTTWTASRQGIPDHTIKILGCWPHIYPPWSKHQKCPHTYFLMKVFFRGSIQIDCQKRRLAHSVSTPLVPSYLPATSWHRYFDVHLLTSIPNPNSFPHPSIPHPSSLDPHPHPFIPTSLIPSPRPSIHLSYIIPALLLPHYQLNHFKYTFSLAWPFVSEPSIVKWAGLVYGGFPLSLKCLWLPRTGGRSMVNLQLEQHCTCLTAPAQLQHNKK